MRYAKGKKSVAMSDRSGFKVKYRTLKETWDGLQVEPEEWEPKHPQLNPPRNVVDATALFKPRPNNDPSNVRLELAFDFFSANKTSLDSTEYKRPDVGVSAKGSIGLVALSCSTSISGVAGTGAIGTEIPSASILETGGAGSRAIGTETVRTDWAYGDGAYGSGDYGDYES